MLVSNAASRRKKVDLALKEASLLNALHPLLATRVTQFRVEIYASLGSIRLCPTCSSMLGALPENSLTDGLTAAISRSLHHE